MLCEAVSAGPCFGACEAGQHCGTSGTGNVGGGEELGAWVSLP